MSCRYTDVELAEVARHDDEYDAEKARELLASRGLTVGEVLDDES